MNELVSSTGNVQGVLVILWGEGEWTCERRGLGRSAALVFGRPERHCKFLLVSDWNDGERAALP